MPLYTILVTSNKKKILKKIETVSSDSKKKHKAFGYKASTIHHINGNEKQKSGNQPSVPIFVATVFHLHGFTMVEISS